MRVKALYDLHVHSLFSDGELLPSEIARRAEALGYKAIAISDHVDPSNMEWVLTKVLKAREQLQDHFNVQIVVAVELTHLPPKLIEKYAKQAKALGAELVLVHGETIVEPVAKGTNRAAASCGYVDILAHPGLIAVEEAEKAVENGVFLEISARSGHSLSNGHVVKVAEEAGAKLLLNSDLHSPSDFLTPDHAIKVVLGAGVPRNRLEEVLLQNPKKLLREL